MKLMKCKQMLTFVPKRSLGITRLYLNKYIRTKEIV